MNEQKPQRILRVILQGANVFCDFTVDKSFDLQVVKQNLIETEWFVFNNEQTQLLVPAHEIKCMFVWSVDNPPTIQTADHNIVNFPMRPN